MCVTMCTMLARGYVHRLSSGSRNWQNDHKWSVGLHECLADVCSVIGIKFTMPEYHISHRWLSAYDRSLDILRLWDGYKLFYHGFLTPSDRAKYEDVMSDILQQHNVSVQQKAVIQKIWRDLSERKKTLTEDGKKRKERIFNKVLFQEKKTLLVLNFYKAVLPLLKSYVSLFQSSEPLIHKLNDKQEELRQFMSNFIYREKILGGPKLATQKSLKAIGPQLSRFLPWRDGIWLVMKRHEKVHSEFVRNRVL